MLKPLTLGLLIGAAATAALPGLKTWLIAALVLSVVGDVALLFTRDEAAAPDGPFLTGIFAFLLAQLCYITVFSRFGLGSLSLYAGGLIVAGLGALLVPAVLRGAWRAAGREFTVFLAAYSAAVAAMTLLAVGTGSVLVAIGGVLFLASDSLIGRQRFVGPVRNGDLLVAVSYHLAQFAIVLGLLTA